MKRTKKVVAMLTVTAALAMSSTAALAGVGNGLPGNPDYNLELIAYDHCPSDSKTGSNGHVIQLQANFTDSNVAGSTKVTLNKTNKIFLYQGSSFQVLDGNACDGDGAGFQLPAGGYAIYARAVGKLGSQIDMTTCGFITDPTTGQETAVCSSGPNVVQTSTKSKKFTNVTTALTTITVTIDGVVTTLPLFDPALSDYFWSVDTKGKAHAQLFFLSQ